MVQKRRKVEEIRNDVLQSKTQIINLILTRKLRAGEKVYADSALLKYGDTTTSGRQKAIEELVIDRLLTRQGTSVHVANCDHKMQEALVAARILVEASVLYSLCNSKEEIDYKDANAHQATLRDLTLEEKSFDVAARIKFVTTDLEMHLSFCRADENTFATQLVTQSYYALLLSLTDPLPLYEHAKCIVAEHEQILNALAERDSRAAVTNLHHHLSHAVGRWSPHIPNYVTTDLKAVLSHLSKAPH